MAVNPRVPHAPGDARCSAMLSNAGPPQDLKILGKHPLGNTRKTLLRCAQTQSTPCTLLTARGRVVCCLRLHAFAVYGWQQLQILTSQLSFLSASTPLDAACHWPAPFYPYKRQFGIQIPDIERAKSLQRPELAALTLRSLSL